MAVRPRVVIVGAGFGGLAAASSLADQPVDVTLIDRENYTTFQPLLYQVATSGLNPADVGYPVRGMFHSQRNLRFRMGEATGVDWDKRQLQLRDGTGLEFDQLILAIGATTSWFGTTGAAEHGFPLYTLDDAVDLRNHIVQRFEAADADNAEVGNGALTFVVVGGGPTGVETAGALAELVSAVFHRDYPHLDLGRARVILAEAMDTLLTPFSDPSQQQAIDRLRRRHVEVRLGSMVEEVSASDVRFADGDTVPAQTVVWAAGVAANPLAAALGLPTGKGGRVQVGKDLGVTDCPGVWAIGDVAAATGRDGEPLPQLASVAMQAGPHVGEQVMRHLEGKPTRAFKYRDRGIMATIGRRAAVAELPAGIRLSGTPAWLAWLGLHIFYLAGMRNRVSVMFNWAWSYVTWDRGARLILRPWSGTRQQPKPPEQP